MRFSFLAVLLFAALAQAKWESCSKWWPKIKPGDHFTVNAQCKLFPGYPKTFGSTTVTVTYTKNWGRAGVKGAEVAPVLHKALDKSIDYYSSLANLPSDIVIILTVAVDGTTFADTFYPSAKKPPCQIKTYKRWTTDAAGQNVPRALQALAHELYHCVQGYHKLGTSKEPLWVLEGSANYFSNRVFPTSNVEWPGPDRHYHPSLPIYAHAGNDVYTTSLYFQALEVSRGPEYLNDWVLATPPTPDKEERTRLSHLTDFGDDFFIFAQKLAREHIRDTSGSLVKGLPKINPEAVPISFDKAGTTSTATLRTVPFTVTVFKLSFKAGQTVIFYSSANDDQRVAYREPDDDVWTPMPTSLSSHGQVEQPCNANNKDASKSILVLFISTADAHSDMVKITVKRKHVHKCHAPGGFVHYPLKNPDTAGGKCPHGTHISKTAAWCCPDGMELDEAVASTISICCPTCKLHISGVSDAVAY
ncbi:hypothetical protein B0T10DRAFT_532704 [Thelonectria olida]|uniref:Uncharacterized protein n=1 Tax=Thelonectria olida TaxID=1576542 RepID=A0A9P8VU97_9HYPO|nr:hypothetical protein B0T10DRAFT_532704 [Thelonectria olida]